MNTVPSRRDRSSNKVRLKSSPLVNPPRLHVPTSSVTDKTPTPTKLLRAADELGLFQEVDFGQETISPGKNYTNN